MDQNKILNICTVADSKYTLKGLAMYHSLKDLHVTFLLHWLCIDRAAYDHLKGLNLPNIIIYDLVHFENTDPSLRQARTNPPSKYGDSYSQYVWTLTPYFVNRILERYIAPDDFLIYCDSDIYWFTHPQAILDIVSHNSIGIHTHRFSPTREKLDTGWYNIGVTVFKRDMVGLSLSILWKQWLLDPKNPFYDEYGTCGDQAYAQLFPLLFPSHVRVFDINSPITHLAPWCTELETDKKLAFFHFSHFTYDQNKWSDSSKGEWNPSKHPHIKPYYDNYYKIIKQCSVL